eukprot:403348152
MLTFINKSIYVKFGFQSPLDLFLTQCICNVVICSSLMFYKELNPTSFKFFDQIGMKIPPMSESLQKIGIGCQLGLVNLITVFFGLYAVKNVNIPMFLTFRRCSILTTVICNFFILRTIPDLNLSLTLLLSVVGSCVAGWESLDTQWFGYFLVWMNNLSQSIYNVYVSKVNKEKKVLPFEINFFFACCGLPLALIYTYQTGEIHQLTDIIEKSDTETSIWFISYVIISGVMGIVITMSVLMVVTINGPIWQNIVGNSKDIILTFVGFVFFEDAKLTLMMGTGLTLSFMGAAVYVWDQLYKSRLALQKQK